MPGFEAVQDIPEAVYSTIPGRQSKQLRVISCTAEDKPGVNLFVA